MERTARHEWTATDLDQLSPTTKSSSTLFPSFTLSSSVPAPTHRIRQTRSRHSNHTHSLSDPLSSSSENTEFLLSLLQAGPSFRDSKKFLAGFEGDMMGEAKIDGKGKGRERANEGFRSGKGIIEEGELSTTQTNPSILLPSDTLNPLQPIIPLQNTTTSSINPNSNPLVSHLLSRSHPRTALVKLQGPFTDVQLDSVAKGMVYLERLGLVSVLVVDRGDLMGMAEGVAGKGKRKRLSEAELRKVLLREVERTVAFLVRHRAKARAILSTVVRSRNRKLNNVESDSSSISPSPTSTSNSSAELGNGSGTETYVELEGLSHIRRAVLDGEIPVLAPIAMDEHCRSRPIGGDLVIRALAEGMSKKFGGEEEKGEQTEEAMELGRMNLTPMRLLIINREGGIPSYARSGLPHLSINLESEYDFIRQTFRQDWIQTHPTALSNMALANQCLQYMPTSASAVIVSHKSPAALIANLITNKPAYSASLPHSLLVEGEGHITRDTPTLIRKGLPIRIIRTLDELAREKFGNLLEKSFRRKLDDGPFYERLEKRLDFVIVAGDYAGAALCTHEGPLDDRNRSGEDEIRHTPICYLDKFAVLPSHQGDGTVDFLWVALRDETFGLGLKDAANPNIGSLSGVGSGRDLVWRSRADNPVNKWYFERSNGFMTRGKWKMFWCDAEDRVRGMRGPLQGDHHQSITLKAIEEEERGRLTAWADVIEAIPGAWTA